MSDLMDFLKNKNMRRYYCTLLEFFISLIFVFGPAALISIIGTVFFPPGMKNIIFLTIFPWPAIIMLRIWKQKEKGWKTKIECFVGAS